VKRVRNSLANLSIWIYVRERPRLWIVITIGVAILAFAIAASAEDCRQRGLALYECGLGSP
jgi:hypothetical protein